MGVTRSQEYLPVHQDESFDGSEIVEPKINSRRALATSIWSHLAHWTPWVLVCCLLALNWYTHKTLAVNLPSDPVWSPASPVSRFKNVVFSAGFEDDFSPYSGLPNEENNKLWEDLFDVGITRIPESEAIQMTNRTSAIEDDPGYYAVTIDVFHQLHCLNAIRKHVFREQDCTEHADANETYFSLKHMDHCIDQIRQSLMCSADLTPIPYGWYPRYNQVNGMFDVAHTCRDFEAVKEWARERRSDKFTIDVRVPNPLGDFVHE